MTSRNDSGIPAVLIWTVLNTMTTFPTDDGPPEHGGPDTYRLHIRGIIRFGMLVRLGIRCLLSSWPQWGCHDGSRRV